MLFAAMPESDSAQKKIEREAAAMQKTLEELQVEFNKKYEEYLKLTNDPSTSPLILKTKRRRTANHSAKKSDFSQQAEQTIAAQAC